MQSNRPAQSHDPRSSEPVPCFQADKSAAGHGPSNGLAVLQYDTEVAVIGDIHGRFDLLSRLLAKLPENLPLLVLGDVVDRGPDSRSCIELLVQRGAVGVRGNHEEWFIRWATGRGFDTSALSPLMGGLPTLESYGVIARTAGGVERESWRVPASHGRWVSTLAAAADLVVLGQRYWLTHAGVPCSSAEALPTDQVVPHLARRHPAQLLWGSTLPERVPTLDRPVIMGHVPRRAALDGGHVIAIDTGAGTLPNGGLTAVILPSRQFVTVA